MTTSISTMPDRSRPSRAVATEIRAEMGRQGLSQAKLAASLGVSQVWVSRRVGVRADVDMTLEEVLEMAKALRLSPEGLLRYAIRDSNPEPSGSGDSAPDQPEHSAVVLAFPLEGRRSA